MKVCIKIIVAILLLLCLLDMPYGYFNLVRFVSTCAFAYMAFHYFKDNKEEFGFIFSALVILFQPFFKIALGRLVWNIVDVIVAVILLYSIILDLRHKQNGDN